MEKELNSLKVYAVLRIHDILGWIRIRIRGSMPLTNGSGTGFGSGSGRILDPVPVFFVIDLQDASKNLIFNTIFSAYYFVKVQYIYIFFQR
jgi:hypothetical protein